MATYEKLKGIISLATNSPGVPTGYGVQAKMLVERMKRHGIDIAALSNYGLEGQMSTYKTKYGEIPHYPRGYTLYSGDVMKQYHEHHVAGRPLENFIMTLYDAWVYLDAKLDDTKVISWLPLDHITLPPKVEAWCRKDNVEIVAMSPHGKRQLADRRIESTYIPHAVDTKVFKPTHTMHGIDIREFYGVPKDKFLVGMVAANKANGSIHRKAFAENILAFSLFKKQHPDAYLYIHADPTKVFGGFDLLNLIRSVGLEKDDVLFPDPQKLKFGYTDEEMAALYTGMDVLLHVSYGEGFGVPAIEAQACATPVIGSNWAATADLVSEDGLLVEGQPFWDEAQISFFQIPIVTSIIGALNKMHERPREKSMKSREFALQFDVETVWDKYWMPFLKAKLS